MRNLFDILFSTGEFSPEEWKAAAVIFTLLTIFFACL